MNKHFKDEILALRKAGKVYKEIRDILGCTMSTISYHCRNENIASGYLNQHGVKISEDKIKLANELYQKGYILRDISKEVGVNRGTIKLYIEGYKTPDRTTLLTRSNYTVNWRKRAKIKLVEYKGGECQICGYSKCIDVLSFHHVDPSQKDFTIGGKSWSWDKLKTEADKCVLVCANCHKEVHAGLHTDVDFHSMMKHRSIV